MAMDKNQQEIIRLESENLQLVKELEQLSAANTLLREQIKGLVSTTSKEKKDVS